MKLISKPNNLVTSDKNSLYHHSKFIFEKIEKETNKNVDSIIENQINLRKVFLSIKAKDMVAIIENLISVELIEKGFMELYNEGTIDYALEFTLFEMIKNSYDSIVFKHRYTSFGKEGSQEPLLIKYKVIQDEWGYTIVVEDNGIGSFPIFYIKHKKENSCHEDLKSGEEIFLGGNGRGISCIRMNSYFTELKTGLNGSNFTVKL